MSSNSSSLPHIFGPILSRRLGLSLGLDMVPFKTCSLNCAYCECGKTTDFSIKRKPYVAAEILINELDKFFKTTNEKIDVITFAGSGEPTLNSELPKVLKHIENNYPEIKTAILTNSTLLNIKDVREEIMEIDFVLPSIDAVSENVFKKINSPAKGLTSEMVTSGLIQFSKEYKKTLWVEVFILADINDGEDEVSKFKELLTEVNPTRVQLNTLDRPGAFKWAESASKECMAKVAKALQPLPVEIISRKTAPTISNTNRDVSEDLILSTIARRPLTVEDISATTALTVNEAEELLSSLLDKNKIAIENTATGKFYKVID